MKVSYKWLQSFYESPLPKVEELVDTANLKMVEVDGVEEIDGDSILDLKILADRAAYMLSHEGVAREFAATLDLKLGDRQIPRVTADSNIVSPKVKIEDNKLCRRYTARRVENVTVTESPDWLKSSLGKLGQRSINNIVDLANFVMFDIGQPLHAFDADKVEGDITIRLAKEGESLETLDNKQIKLRPDVLVIADNAGPIAIAGVKGGKRAEVTSATKNLILESASFNPSSVRKTSTSYGLRTDASKRFENNLTADLALEAQENFSALIAEAIPAAKFSPVTDEYPSKEQVQTVTVDPVIISARLGMDVPVGEQKNILIRMGLGVKEEGTKFAVTVPTYRRDLNIPEDFAEEIGRIYGYDKLPETLPKPVPVKVNKEYYYTEKIRNILCSTGFSEVYLYSLVEKGELEVQLPLAEDKKSYRTNLFEGLDDCLERNRPNLALFGGTSIDIFEIGHVYENGAEKLKLAIASNDGRRVKEALVILGRLGIEPEQDKLLAEFGNAFIGLLETISKGPTTHEIDLGYIIESLPEPSSYDDLNIALTQNVTMFQQYSQYPFILRDIAMWTPSLASDGVDPRKKVEAIIMAEGGEWLTKISLFDMFSKEDKTSYAFRLVFQSMERTLTDQDVNAVMARITKALTKEGYTIR